MAAVQLGEELKCIYVQTSSGISVAPFAQGLSPLFQHNKC